MRLPLTLLGVVAQAFAALAQGVSFLPATLQWGTAAVPITEATTNLTQTLAVSAANNPVQIDSIKLFTVYADGAGRIGQAFTASRTAFTVQPGGTEQVTFQFVPRHNLALLSTALVCGRGINGCLPVPLQADVTYRKGYYASTRGQSGQALFDALRTRIRTNYTDLGYNGARDRMFMNIDNKRTNGQGATTNTLECIYTGRLTIGYTSRSQAQNDNFNTEHTFPQNFFNSAQPMQSDLHHLFPTDNDANNRRASFPFDTVAGTPTWQQGGSKLGSIAGRTVFEPRVQQKGRTARAMCYFVVRHQDYSGFFAGQEAVLRRWAQVYAPDTVDLRRNADIQSFQGNRNPFADYPQLLERIPSLTNPGQPFPSVTLARTYPPAGTLNLGDAEGFYFTTVNEGNTPVVFQQPASLPGLVVESVGVPNATIPTGGSATFRVLPTPNATPGTYTFTPTGGTAITLTLADPNAARPGLAVMPLVLRPNPATGAFATNLAGKLNIYDMMGRLVVEARAEALTDVSALPAGMYVVRVGRKSARLQVL